MFGRADVANAFVLMHCISAGVSALHSRSHSDCYVESADAGLWLLPDTFRKQMVRGGFCAKNVRRFILPDMKAACSCLIDMGHAFSAEDLSIYADVE